MSSDGQNSELDAFLKQQQPAPVADNEVRGVGEPQITAAKFNRDRKRKHFQRVVLPAMVIGGYIVVKLIRLILNPP